MENRTKEIDELKNIWLESNNESGIQIADEQFSIIDQIGNFFAAGDYYYYIFNIETPQIEFISKGAEKVYELPLEEINLETLLKMCHPEDLTDMVAKEEVVSNFFFNDLLPEQVIDYKTVYLTRVISKKGITKTLLHQTKPLNVSENGRIHKILGVHTDITHLNTPIDDKVSFISHKYPSYYAVPTKKVEVQQNSTFTKREKEIIKLVSDGFTNNEIAIKLCISQETVKTHKKNILQKAKSKNTAQLITFCIREGII